MIVYNDGLVVTLDGDTWRFEAGPDGRGELTHAEVWDLIGRLIDAFPRDVVSAVRGSRERA